MDIQLEDDKRTLREFYPDPEMRHQVHYEFAHRFLPWYIHQNPYAFFCALLHLDLPEMPATPTRFIHSRWGMFERMAGLMDPNPFDDDNRMVFRRVSDLTMSVHEAAGYPVALVQMPTPEEPVEASFVAATVLHSGPLESLPRDVPARVFTLELQCDRPEDSQRGVFCEWTKDSQHLNFGVLVPAQPDPLLQAIASALRAPGTSAVASFTPSGDGTPGTVRLHGKVDPPPPGSPATGKPR